jgi:hypothetical protein
VTQIHAKMTAHVPSMGQITHVHVWLDIQEPIAKKLLAQVHLVSMKEAVQFPDQVLSVHVQWDIQVFHVKLHRVAVHHV